MVRAPAPPLFMTPSIHVMNRARQRLLHKFIRDLFFRSSDYCPEGADVLVAGDLTRVLRQARFRHMVTIHRDAQCGNDRFNDELRVILDALSEWRTKAE